MTPLTLMTSGFDMSSPLQVSLSGSTGSGSVTLKPIRVGSDGTIVVAMPLHIDGATGKTADFDALITVSQGGVSSPPQPLTVRDLPQLADLGVALGTMSRAFYIHQQLAGFGVVNVLQAIALLRTPGPDTTAIRNQLATQAKNAILARNDVDRIINDNTTSIPIGTSANGVAVAFNAQALEMQDRLVAQYLLAYPFTPAASPRQPKGAAPEALPTGALALSQTIATAQGWVTYKTAQQSFLSGTTLDEVLAAASVLQTVVSVGASLVVVGAALASAPEIALGAGAVLTYAALAGVAIGAASIGNDLVNVATSGYKYAVASGSDTAARNDFEKAGAALATDAVNTYLQAEGIGGLSQAFDLTAGINVLEGLFDETGKSAVLGAAQFIASTANLYVQKALSTDGQALMPAFDVCTPTNPLGQVIGQADVTNPGPAVFDGLTGVEVNNGLLTNLADVDGAYDLILPVGSPSLDYKNLDFSLYDPISGMVINSAMADVSGVNPSTPTQGPDLGGVCNDNDASAPDSDDPDCD
jgi:hypothetical protein